MSMVIRMPGRARRSATVAAAALVLVASGCTRESKPGGDGGGGQQAGKFPNETYYWISQDSTLPLFVQHDYKGWKLAAKQLGVKAKLIGPTNINLAQFISTIEQTCAQKPAGVSVVGWDPSLTAAVNQCIAQGVPVVTDDADLPNSKRIGFVGTSWYEIGVAQAQAMKKALPNGGKVATLSIINADNMKQARQGFAATLKGSGIQVVANEDDGGDAQKAASKTSSLLAAYSDLSGVAGFDAESGTGIVQALREGSKLGKVKVTTVEQTPQFFNNVKSGVVQAIIVQKRELFTYYALKMLFDYNHSGLTVGGLDKKVASPVPMNLDTGLVVVTKSNVDQVIAANKKD